MYKAWRALAAGVAVAGAGIALAAPSAAEPLEGSYTQTITGGLPMRAGVTDEVVLTPCGADCTHWQVTGNPVGFELRLQGGQWVSTDGKTKLDAATLQGTHAMEGFPAENTFVLTKNG